MMSHCSASLKLTPWHEGTFASSVIYSPPLLPPLFPFPSLLLSLTLVLLPPSRSCLKMSFIILSLSRSHSFPAARELREKEKGRKWGTDRPNHSSARFHGGNWSSSLCDPGPPLKMAACCAVQAAMLQTLWGNTAARTRRSPLGQGGREGIVCQSLCEDFDRFQSQTDGITPRLPHRYVGIARSERKYN